MVLRPPVRRPELGSILAQPITVQPVEDKIRTAMADKLRDQLGVASLPAEMDQAIATAAASTAQQVVELGLAQVADQAARDVGRPSLLTRFDDKLNLAATSIGHLTQSDDVERVLRNRAELLAKKKGSLVTAGFSDDEAMQIILADIAARGH